MIALVSPLRQNSEEFARVHSRPAMRGVTILWTTLLRNSQVDWDICDSPIKGSYAITVLPVISISWAMSYSPFPTRLGGIVEKTARLRYDATACSGPATQRMKATCSISTLLGTIPFSTRSTGTPSINTKSLMRQTETRHSSLPRSKMRCKHLNAGRRASCSSHSSTLSANHIQGSPLERYMRLSIAPRLTVQLRNSSPRERGLFLNSRWTVPRLRPLKL